MWFWGRKSRGVDRDRRNVSCCVMRCDCVRESQVTSHGSPAGVCQMAGRSSSSAIHAFFNEGLCARYFGSTGRGKRNKHKNPTRVTGGGGTLNWISTVFFYWDPREYSTYHLPRAMWNTFQSNRRLQIYEILYFFLFQKEESEMG